MCTTGPSRSAARRGTATSTPNSTKASARWSRRAKVALAELPCWRPVDNGSGTTAFPERGDDRRTRHLNALLARAAAADPADVTALRAPAAYCTDNAVATSLAERWDGVHYGRAGGARLFTALLPQLLAIHVR